MFAMWRLILAGGIGAITILVLVGVNSAIQEDRLVVLSPFAKWVSAVAAAQRRALLAEDTPAPVSVTLEGKIGEQDIPWHFKLDTTTQSGERVVRLLELIREAGVIQDSTVDQKCGAGLCLKTFDSTTRFEVQLTPAQIEGSLALQNLIKLMEVYSRTPVLAVTAQVHQG